MIKESSLQKKVHYSTMFDVLKNGSLISTIKFFNPEMIFIHLGINDVKSGIPFQDFKENFKRLISLVLEKTTCKLCFSLIIPIPGYPNLNTKIKFANQRMAEIITEIRKQDRYENRLYTAANDGIGGYLERYVSNNGESLRLSPRGQAKLWLRLRDSINRMSLSIKDTDCNSTRSRNQDE